MHDIGSSRLGRFWVLTALGVGLVSSLGAQGTKAPPATKAAPPATKAAPAAASAGYKPVGWDILNNFSLDPYAGSAAVLKAIPPKAKAQDGLNVIVGGYMLPFEFAGKGVSYFALTESLDACGFGEMLNPTNWVATSMKPGKWATYHEYTFVEVFGKIKVEPFYQDGQLSNIYSLVADSVRIAK